MSVTDDERIRLSNRASTWYFLLVMRWDQGKISSDAEELYIDRTVIYIESKLAARSTIMIVIISGLVEEDGEDYMAQ